MGCVSPQPITIQSFPKICEERRGLLIIFVSTQFNQTGYRETCIWSGAKFVTCGPKKPLIDPLFQKL